MGARQTVRRNLERLAAARAADRELYLLSLSELAEQILSSLGEVGRIEEMMDLLGEGSFRELLAPHAVGEDVLGVLRPLMVEMSSLDLASDFAALSLLLSEQIARMHGRTLPWRERALERARVAYLPSPRAEAAFLRLCKERPETALLYTESMEGACDALAEKADYALLPYTAEDGTPLRSVLQLVGRHDLYLCASVPVQGEDAAVRYALFSKEIAPFLATHVMQTDVRVSATSLAHLSAMMAQLPLFGFQQTAYFPEGEAYGRVLGRLSLAGTGDALALFIYFSLFANGFSLLGRYPLLSAEE